MVDKLGESMPFQRLEEAVCKLLSITFAPAEPFGAIQSRKTHVCT